MKNKPLIFTFLTILCFVEPLIKIIYFKATTHFDFAVIFSNLLVRTSPREILDFWLIFPLAGLMIMKLRMWTYFAFMGILTYIIVNIFTYESYSWPYNSETPFLYHYLVSGLAASVFLLFLSPKVREPFFDRRVRLWESIQRYPVRINAGLKNGSHVSPIEILNLSKTGAFLKDVVESPGKEMVLSFTYAGMGLDLPITVRHDRPFNGQEGRGVMFENLGWKQKIKLARVVFELKHKKHPATVIVKPV